VQHRGQQAYVCYLRDLRETLQRLDEMRLREIAEENNRIKSQFLARMSHEIRTPMNAILGLTEMQLMNPLPEDIYETFMRIHSSSGMLMGLINDILDLSRIEAGKMDLQRARFDTVGMLHGAVILNLHHIGNKHIDFSLHIDESLPEQIIGDELRLKQILNNLLSNAFKYTLEGHVTLTCTMDTYAETQGCFVEGEPQADPLLVLTVTDTGLGMTPEQLNKLYDAYARFHEKNAVRYEEGTGLGMHITYQLVRAMGGAISAQSAVGQGTAFTVRIPVVAHGDGVLGPEKAQALSKMDITHKSLYRRTTVVREKMTYGSVLIVDDLEMNLHVTRGLLAPYGLSVHTAGGGQEAIDLIKDGAVYDLILMDHMMPQLDGIETTKLLRADGYDYPIVVLTANTLAGQAEIYMENGFSGFLSKPVDIQQLNACLNRFIRDRKRVSKVKANVPKEGDAPAPEKPINPRLVASFLRDTRKALDVFMMTMAAKDLTPDILQRYKVSAHGLKMALTYMKQTALAKMAARLEEAGHNANTGTIWAQTPGFIAELQQVMAKLETTQSHE